MPIIRNSIPERNGSETSKFDFTKNTPASVIRRRLEEARELGGIYLIARIVQVLNSRHINEKLRKSEERKLLKAVDDARWSENLPLKHWLPRGYQIARLLCTAKATVPGFKPNVTKCDIRLMKDALVQFRQEKTIWGKEQIPSLIGSAKYLGVDLGPKSRLKGK